MPMHCEKKKDYLSMFYKKNTISDFKISRLMCLLPFLCGFNFLVKIASMPVFFSVWNKKNILVFLLN